MYLIMYPTTVLNKLWMLNGYSSQCKQDERSSSATEEGPMNAFFRKLKIHSLAIAIIARAKMEMKPRGMLLVKRAGWRAA